MPNPAVAIVVIAYRQAVEIILCGAILARVQTHWTLAPGATMIDDKYGLVRDLLPYLSKEGYLA